MLRVGNVRKGIFRTISICIISALILNDLSFAASAGTDTLSPNSRLKPISDPKIASYFNHGLVFYSICFTIGKYLHRGISEHTLIPEIKHNIKPALLASNERKDQLLKGFRIDELRYDKDAKAFFLPLYRNGKKRFEYKYFIEGDPKDADMTIPIDGGVTLYVQLIDLENGARMPSSSQPPTQPSRPAEPAPEDKELEYLKLLEDRCGAHQRSIARYLGTIRDGQWADDPADAVRQISSLQKSLRGMSRTIADHTSKHGPEAGRHIERFIALNNAIASTAKDLETLRYQIERFARNGEFDAIFRPIFEAETESGRASLPVRQRLRTKRLFADLVTRLGPGLLYEIDHAISMKFRGDDRASLKSAIAHLTATVEMIERMLPAMDVEGVLAQGFELAHQAETLLHELRNRSHITDIRLGIDTLILEFEVKLDEYNRRYHSTDGSPQRAAAAAPESAPKETDGLASPKDENGESARELLAKTSHEAQDRYAAIRTYLDTASRSDRPLDLESFWKALADIRSPLRLLNRLIVDGFSRYCRGNSPVSSSLIDVNDFVILLLRRIEALQNLSERIQNESFDLLLVCEEIAALKNDSPPTGPDLDHFMSQIGALTDAFTPDAIDRYREEAELFSASERSEILGSIAGLRQAVEALQFLVRDFEPSDVYAGSFKPVARIESFIRNDLPRLSIAEVRSSIIDTVTAADRKALSAFKRPDASGPRMADGEEERPTNMAARSRTRSEKRNGPFIPQMPLTPSYLRSLPIDFKIIADEVEVRRLAMALAEGMKQGGFLAKMTNSGEIPDILEQDRCAVFSLGRIRIACFEIDRSRKLQKKPVMRRFVISIMDNDTVIGHGIISHALNGDGFSGFRYSIHGDAVSEVMHNINYTGKGYGKEALVLIMAAALSGELFSGQTTAFWFAHDENVERSARARQGFSRMQSLLYRAGFDRDLVFRMDGEDADLFYEDQSTDMSVLRPAGSQPEHPTYDHREVRNDKASVARAADGLPSPQALELLDNPQSARWGSTFTPRIYYELYAFLANRDGTMRPMGRSKLALGRIVDAAVWNALGISRTSPEGQKLAPFYAFAEDLAEESDLRKKVAHAEELAATLETDPGALRTILTMLGICTRMYAETARFGQRISDMDDGTDEHGRSMRSRFGQGDEHELTSPLLGVGHISSRFPAVAKAYKELKYSFLIGSYMGAGYNLLTKTGRTHADIDEAIINYRLALNLIHFRDAPLFTFISQGESRAVDRSASDPEIVADIEAELDSLELQRFPGIDDVRRALNLSRRTPPLPVAEEYSVESLLRRLLGGRESVRGLDLGAGGGLKTKEIAQILRKISPESDFYGIEKAPEETGALRNDPDRVIVEADVNALASLGYPAHSYDLVTSFSPFPADIADFVREAKRLLVPGGAIMIILNPRDMQALRAGELLHGGVEAAGVWKTLSDFTLIRFDRGEDLLTSWGHNPYAFVYTAPAGTGDASRPADMSGTGPADHAQSVPAREHAISELKPRAAEGRQELASLISLLEKNPLTPSWTVDGRRAQARIEYDELAEEFAVEPTAETRSAFPELSVLDMHAADDFVPSYGLFGVLRLKIVRVNRKPALFIREIQPSIGLRHMQPLTARQQFYHWNYEAVAHIVRLAREAGFTTFYASTPDEIDHRYLTRLKTHIPHSNLKQNYLYPFRGAWEKVDATIDGRKTGLWHLESARKPEAPPETLETRYANGFADYREIARLCADVYGGGLAGAAIGWIEVTRAWLHRLLGIMSTQDMVVVSKDGKIAGFVSGHMQFGIYSIDHMVIAREFRVGGIGTRLFNHFLEELKMRGFTTFELVIADKTGAMRKIAERAGFAAAEADDPDLLMMSIAPSESPPAGGTHTLATGLRMITRRIQSELSRGRTRPVTVLIKGRPGTGKSRLIRELRTLLKRAGIQRIVSYDQRAHPDTWESLTYYGLSRKHYNAQVIILEGVNQLPTDTQNLDILVKMKIDDNDVRERRLRSRISREIPWWRALSRIRELRDLMDTVEMRDSRAPDIIIDNSLSVPETATEEAVAAQRLTAAATGSAGRIARARTNGATERPGRRDEALSHPPTDMSATGRRTTVEPARPAKVPLRDLWNSIDRTGIRKILYPACGLDAETVFMTFLDQIPAIEDVYLVDNEKQYGLPEIVANVLSIADVIGRHTGRTRYTITDIDPRITAVRTDAPGPTSTMTYEVTMEPNRMGKRYDLSLLDNDTKRTIRFHFVVGDYAEPLPQLDGTSDLTIVKYPGRQGILSYGPDSASYYRNIASHTKPGGYVYATRAVLPDTRQPAMCSLAPIATNTSYSGDPATISADDTGRELLNDEPILAPNKYVLFKRVNPVQTTDTRRAGSLVAQLAAGSFSNNDEVARIYRSINLLRSFGYVIGYTNGNARVDTGVYGADDTIVGGILTATVASKTVIVDEDVMAESIKALNEIVVALDRAGRRVGVSSYYRSLVDIAAKSGSAEEAVGAMRRFAEEKTNELTPPKPQEVSPITDEFKARIQQIFGNLSSVPEDAKVRIEQNDLVDLGAPIIQQDLIGIQIVQSDPNVPTRYATVELLEEAAERFKKNAGVPERQVRTMVNSRGEIFLVKERRDGSGFTAQPFLIDTVDYGLVNVAPRLATVPQRAEISRRATELYNQFLNGTHYHNDLATSNFRVLARLSGKDIDVQLIPVDLESRTERRQSGRTTDRDARRKAAQGFIRLIREMYEKFVPLVAEAPEYAASKAEHLQHRLDHNVRKYGMADDPEISAEARKLHDELDELIQAARNWHDRLLAPTEASEHIQAVRLTDTIKLTKDPRLTRPVILALGTSWIKGYEPGSPQYNAINPVITAVANFCRRNGIHFVSAPDSDLLGEIEEVEAKENLAGARIIVLAGRQSVEDRQSALQPLINDPNAFLAGVDSSAMDESCYVRLVEMLRLAMELGIKELFEGKAELDNPNIKIESLKDHKNACIFLPRVERIPVYQNLLALYKALISA